MKDLHICVENLRNSFSMLHGALYSFLVAHVHFEDSGIDNHHLYLLWVTLGLDTGTAEELSALGLIWRHEKRYVSPHVFDDPAELSRITSCVISVWRFKKFTDSRWCTLAESCRSLVASLLLGLSTLVNSLLHSEVVSHYYLGGFQRLSQEACKRSWISCAR